MPELAIALDYPGRDPALRMVERLGEGADLFKVGLELFTREGPAIVRELRRRDARVFLDLKLHDIPATVAGAVSAAVDAGVDLLTVHASGGTPMLRAAVDAADGRLQLLAVTVLTSLDEHQLAETWGRDAVHVEDEVLRLARTAVSAGIGGLVASAREAADLRAALGPDVRLVTPGIRMASGDRHDQARVTTPGEAVLNGADLLVVGRAVTAASDPAAALTRVRREMEEAATSGKAATSREMVDFGSAESSGGGA